MKRVWCTLFAVPGLAIALWAQPPAASVSQTNPFREVQGKTILIISPHPDDDIIGCGGALANLSGHQNHIIVVFLTSGEVGTEDASLKPEQLRAIRMKEAAAAYRSLNIPDAELIWFGYPDDGLDFAPLEQVRIRLVEIIRRRHPDIVLALDPGLTYFRYHYHDHRVAAIVSTDAIGTAGFPLKYPQTGPGYKVPKVFYFYTAEPNLKLDISDVIDRKVAALAAHRSQFPPAQQHYEENGPPPARSVLEAFIARYTTAPAVELFRQE